MAGKTRRLEDIDEFFSSEDEITTVIKPFSGRIDLSFSDEENLNFDEVELEERLGLNYEFETPPPLTLSPP
jgi:hypothetical protein